MAETPPGTAMRAIFRQQLHQTYAPHAFDNWLVWAGNHGIQIDGIDYPATLARAYIGPDQPTSQARVRVELFVSAVDPRRVRAGDVEARLWTDANLRGFVDAQGRFQDDPGRFVPMHLVCDEAGVPRLTGNNFVFVSEPITLHTTGVFSYTVAFSASDDDDPTRRQWVGLSDLADNRNGVIVVSPTWVRDCPVIAEVCAGKIGARLVAGKFHSGTLREVTAALPDIPAQVVYLLPFFRTGHRDARTGADVRKGELGSPYAVYDFYQIEPRLITPPEDADVPELVRDGLITDGDAATAGLPAAAAFARQSVAGLARRLGRQRLLQIVGRAELRRLARRAHELGKRVIFDLVLMQTSRDCPLIEQHPEWYLLDEHGAPRIHQIAWLVYSDVALFDLVFNWPLQDYLSRVAPYWIRECGLDGVRIDASQTVDRPFLKRIKNRINLVCPDALVLGETLCALDEAVDIPVDMIYALLVDFHRDMERATPLIDFLERMHGRFAPRTVAMAYFENHDSPRATRVWRDRCAALLAARPDAAAYWAPRGGALVMALLKNAQASLIDASAGYHGGTNLACGLEWGSWWGELQPTDFENATVFDPGTPTRPPHATLATAWRRLAALLPGWGEVRRGRVYYHRFTAPGGDPEDRVFAYVRYDDAGALLFLHNLDAAAPRHVHLDFGYLPWRRRDPAILFDTHAAMGLGDPAPRRPGDGPENWLLWPLQSLVVRLHGPPAPVPQGAGSGAPAARAAPAAPAGAAASPC